VNDTPPFKPALVTVSGDDLYDGCAITAEHAWRGLGDCRSVDRWVWDGARFIHSDSFTTGQCQLLANGGAWTLPTIVTQVRQQCAPRVGDEESDGEEPAGYIEEE
jgi:hypothetical protein